jgi:hypothetical protein
VTEDYLQAQFKSHMVMLRYLIGVTQSARLAELFYLDLLKQCKILTPIFRPGEMMRTEFAINSLHKHSTVVIDSHAGEG